MPAPKSSYEGKDFNPRGAMAAAGALLLSLAVIAGLLLYFQKRHTPPVSARNLTPAPKTSPLGEGEFESGATREKLESAARARLGTYGWVNREGGVAHIPLARAMEIFRRPKKEAP